MEFSPCFLFVLLAAFSVYIIVQAQDQSGFISLDCGSPRDTAYIEKSTNISYTSDADFIDSGIGRSIKEEYKSTFQQQAWYVRSFPEGSRNCYRLNLTTGDEYLIRASFLYGNYDGLNKSSRFELHLGPNLWTAVAIVNATTPAIFEMIHILKTDHLQVCLVKTGDTAPFISALELRKLKNTTYTTQTGSLQLFLRPDVGSITNQVFRYGIDPFDRVWTPYNFKNWSQISTNETINTENDYKPPQLAMITTSVPTDPEAPMNISLTGTDGTVQFYVFMHIAEIQKLQPNETREFNVLYNGKHLYGPFRPIYLTTSTIYTPAAVGPDANGQYQFSLQRTGNSTLPPLLNAMEIYTVKSLEQPETDEKQVEAMLNIKSVYELEKESWQGDPCAPQDYKWEGLNCSYDDFDPPKITSLNLSSSGLTGKIAQSISDLSELQILDLSNNNLTGSVPAFLADMETLKVINLSGNKLNGSVPGVLLEKSKKGSITLSMEGNLGICASSSCTKKKKKTALVPVVASVASLLVLVAGLATFLILKKKKQKSKPEGFSYTGTTPLHSSSNHPYESPLVAKNRKFAYMDVLKMTNNFERVLGRGGFGVVYYGQLDNNPVAVKLLTQASVEGYKQFKAEVELLLRVHHRDLTGLVGYCDEGEKFALIYEFMANGDLKEHLSGKRGPAILSWESRLHIAVESAQGLEYLHNGCKPQIVHRDVKTTNILLNERFQAKLSDFGLSRSFPVGNETHVSTVVAGTPGYLDPEYYRTNWLTEKSDVYSFGVVLFEIITNKPVIDQTRERPHIGEWVGLMLSKGDINNIVDPKLQGDFDSNTVWKAVEVAMACVNPVSARRPTMTHVVMELNMALAAEIARNQGSRVTDRTHDSSIELTMNFTTELSPGAR